METQRLTTPVAEEILNLYFPVLDHGFVALVDYMGGDLAIEQAARVSYGGNAVSNKPREASETRNLLRYMMRHRHTSVNEMVELKFHCSMPIFIARQWIRHRTANVNEMSGRYSLMPMLFYTPPEEQLRVQSKTNKQGRDETTLDADLVNIANVKWREQRQDAVANYEWMCNSDFARELARIDLPLSTYTQWYWKIDLHNLLHFLTLRVDSHAQWEIQQYGKIMAGMLKRVAPIAYEAWIDYEVCGVRLSRSERDIIRFIFKALRERYSNAATVEGVAAQLKIDGTPTRELVEFETQFGPTADNKIPNFELDLSQTKPASYFAAEAAAAVPNVK